MNADQLKGQWVQFKGDLKEQWGKFTDNDLEETQGSMTSLSGRSRNGMATRRVNC